MAFSEPARAAARRAQSTVLAFGFACFALLPGATACATPCHRHNAQDPHSPVAVRWPRRGQAASVLGTGRPAASARQHPVPIAGLAKVMTAYLTLKRYPLSSAQDWFTIIVSAAEAQ